MAKATTTEIEVVVKQKGIALDLSDDEAKALRSVLAQTTTTRLVNSGLHPINEALKAAGVEVDTDCIYEVM